jgi:hypothetical protein
MEELQRVFMPFAVGSIAMIYSAIHSISIVNRTRYKLKDFKHPYSPWKDEQSDPTSYRAYKAQENQREWLVYTIPIYFAFCVYTPTLPYVGKYMQLVAIALSLVYGFANVQYCEAYAKDVVRNLHSTNSQ